MKVTHEVHLGSKHTRQKGDTIEEVSFRHELESELSLSPIESGLFPFTRLVDNKLLLSELPELQIYKVLWSLDKNTLHVRWARDDQCAEEDTSITNIKVWWTTNKKPELKSDWAFYQNAYKIPTDVIEGERVDIFFEVYDANRKPVYLTSNAFSVQVIRRDKSKDDSNFYQHNLNEIDIANHPELNKEPVEPNSYDMGLRAYLDPEHIQLVWNRVASKEFSVERYTLKLLPDQKRILARPKNTPWTLLPVRLKNDKALYQGTREGNESQIEICGINVSESSTYEKNLLDMITASLVKGGYQQSPNMLGFLETNVEEGALYTWDNEQSTLHVSTEWDVQYTVISTGKIVRLETGSDISKESLDPDLYGTPEYDAAIADRDFLIVRESVLSIESATFAGWTGLKDLEIHGGGYLQGGTLYGVKFNRLYIGKGVKTLGGGFTAGTASNDTVQVIQFHPEGVEEIESGAINDIRVKEILLPLSLRTLQSSSLNNLPIVERIHLGGIVRIDAPMVMTGVASQSSKPVYLNMGNSLTYLGYEALGHITKGGELIVSPVLEHMGDFAIANWGEAFGSVSYDQINDEYGWANGATQSEHSLYLPSTLKHVGNGAVQGGRFKIIRFAGNPELFLSEYAFQQSTAEQIIVDTVIYQTSDYTFQLMPFLRSANLGLGVINLHGMAFNSCPNLEGIHIPAQTRSIQGGVLNSCKRLQFVTFDEGVTHIGSPTEEGLLGASLGLLEEIIYPRSLVSLYESGLAASPKIKRAYIGGNLEALHFSTNGAMGDVFIESNVKPASLNMGLSGAPTLTIHIYSLKQFMADSNISDADKTAFRWMKTLPPTPSFPLVNIEVVDRPEPWTFHYTDLQKAEVVHVDSGDEVAAEDFANAKFIDDLVINTTAIHIANDLFPSMLAKQSLKRMKALEGLQDLGREAFAGQYRLRFIELPNSLRRVGSQVITTGGDVLKLIKIPKVGYLSISQNNQFIEWAALGFDVPTATVTPLVPFDVNFSEGQVHGKASINSTVTIVSELDSTKIIHTQTDNYGSFSANIDSLIAAGAVIKLKTTDYVMNQSGETIVDLTGQLPEIQGDWVISPTITVNDDSAHYLASKEQGFNIYDSHADLDLTTAVLRSLSNSSMQQWQAVKDACNELTGAFAWQFDVNTQQLIYERSEVSKFVYRTQINSHTLTGSSLDEVCAQVDPTYMLDYGFLFWQLTGIDYALLRCNIGKDPYTTLNHIQVTKTLNPELDPTYPTLPHLWTWNSQDLFPTPELALEGTCKIYQGAAYGGISNVSVNGDRATATCKSLNNQNNVGSSVQRIDNPNYNPNAEADIRTLPFLTVAEKIVSNITSPNQAVSLMAEVYLEKIANSVLEIEFNDQYVKETDIVPLFEVNKVLRPQT